MQSHWHALLLQLLFTRPVASAYSWDQSQGPFREAVAYAADGVVCGTKYVIARVGLLYTRKAFRLLQAGRLTADLGQGRSPDDWLTILL